VYSTNLWRPRHRHSGTSGVQTPQDQAVSHTCQITRRKSVSLTSSITPTSIKTYVTHPKQLVQPTNLAVGQAIIRSYHRSIPKPAIYIPPGIAQGATPSLRKETTQVMQNLSKPANHCPEAFPPSAYPNALPRVGPTTQMQMQKPNAMLLPSESVNAFPMLFRVQAQSDCARDRTSLSPTSY